MKRSGSACDNHSAKLKPRLSRCIEICFRTVENRLIGFVATSQESSLVNRNTPGKTLSSSASIEARPAIFDCPINKYRSRSCNSLEKAATGRNNKTTERRRIKLFIKRLHLKTF